MLALPPGPFDVVLADPPWQYRQSKGTGLQGCASDQYDVMSLEGLCALPVPKLLAPNALLIMWATWPMMPQALQLMTAWGFTFKSGLVWVKTAEDGSARAGVGYWTRGASEPILLGTRGQVSAPPAGPARQIGIVGDRWYPREFLTAPRRRHSEKPTEIHEFAETMTAHLGGRRLELFARKHQPGWVCWGNQLEEDPLLA